MRDDLSGIAPEMAVYTIDGQRLGEVVELRWPELSEEQVADALQAEGLTFEPDAPPLAAEGRLQPLGTTTPKDRGLPTTASAAAERGDAPTLQPGDPATVPGGSGRDRLRGYGPAAEGGSAILTGPASSAIGDVDPASMSIGAPAEEPTLIVQTPGVLGVVSRLLHIPVDVIGAIDPGEMVTLTCSQDEAIARYGGRPGLVIDEGADATP